MACHPSKWIELVHSGSKSSDVFSVMLERRDGRTFKLLIQVVEEAAAPDGERVLALDAYTLSHAMATQKALFESLSDIYVRSVKSQALGINDSIQVTSLITSMVTGGVSSLVNTLIGKTDPSLAASASHFRYQTNAQIVDKHSRLLAQCHSSTQFVERIRHLVFDWDSNHTWLEARGCVAVGILNNSSHSFVVNVWGIHADAADIGRHVLHGAVERVQMFVMRKTALLKANLGYTATYTH